MTTTLVQTQPIKNMRLTARDLGITARLVIAYDAATYARECEVDNPAEARESLDKATDALAEALDLLTLDPVVLTTEGEEHDEDTSRDGERCSPACGYCGRCS